MTDTNKTIKELVKAGFNEEQAVLLVLRFVTKEEPQKYSSADTALKIEELKLWLIDKFSALKKEQQSIFWTKYIPWIPFVVMFVVVWIVIYLRTRI